MFVVVDLTEAERPTKGAAEPFMELLSPQEQKKLNAYRFDMDFSRGLTGQMLVRAGVLRFAGATSLSGFEFHRNHHNRPYCEWNGMPWSVDYNVTHHGDCVAMVMAENERVGIDITKIETTIDDCPVAEFLSFYEEQFTPNELKYIQGGLTDFECLKRFHFLWSLKESYVKAIGCGIVVPLDLIEFRVVPLKEDSDCVSITTIFAEPYSIELYVNGFHDAKWSFQSSLVKDSLHIVSIASNPPATEWKPYTLTNWTGVRSEIDCLIN